MSGLTAYIRRVAAFQKWGLATPPQKPPPAPVVKPLLAPRGGRYADPELPPVIYRVPTDERIVFLTIDDGAEKNAEFVDLVRDLDLPVSAFLTHEEAGDDYGYFRGLQRLGNGIHNHSVHHVSLPKLSYDKQREEICRQQDTLEREFGVRPRLFRPPYGDYDRDTLRAARSCGVKTLVLWSLEAWARRIDWQEGDKRLRPGDIILSHFRGPKEWGGTMSDMTRRVLRTVQEQGFSVARLEDYL